MPSEHSVRERRALRAAGLLGKRWYAKPQGNWRRELARLRVGHRTDDPDGLQRLQEAQARRRARRRV